MPQYFSHLFLGSQVGPGPHLNLRYVKYAILIPSHINDILVFSSQPTKLPQTLARDQPKSYGMTTVFNVGQ